MLRRVRTILSRPQNLLRTVYGTLNVLPRNTPLGFIYPPERSLLSTVLIEEKFRHLPNVPSRNLANKLLRRKGETSFSLVP